MSYSICHNDDVSTLWLCFQNKALITAVKYRDSQKCPIPYREGQLYGKCGLAARKASNAIISGVQRRCHCANTEPIEQKTYEDTRYFLLDNLGVLLFYKFMALGDELKSNGLKSQIFLFESRPSTCRCEPIHSFTSLYTGQRIRHKHCE